MPAEIKHMYTTILSQTFSSCGKYLACGNDFGDIAIFDLQEVMDHREERSPKGPDLKFPSPDQSRVCSLASTPEFLIAGTTGLIAAWTWASLVQGKPSLAWNIRINTTDSSKRTPLDVNSLVVRSGGDMSQVLYAGLGDATVHVYSLEDGKFLRRFQGHDGYIHSIAISGDELGSCGEDGTVRIWDLRQKSQISEIQPSKESSLARPQYGKWIGDMDLNSTSLVCGGGCKGGLWDLRKLELLTAFEKTEDAGLHVARFHTGGGGSTSVLLSGNTRSTSVFSPVTGEKESKIETTSDIIYFAALHDKAASFAGQGMTIDLYSDVHETRTSLLSFYEEVF